jgi:hypothetical protein
LKENNSVGIHINDSCNVGIGQNNPATKLDVSGVINATNARPIREQLVHRRIFFGVVGDSPLVFGGNFTAVRSNIYGPFSYGLPAVQTGATRRYRLYAIYSDNMTNSGDNQVRITLDGGIAIDFILGRTWGDLNIQRDGYSDWYEGPVNNHHGNVHIRTTVASAGKLYYMELLAYDFF